MICQRLLETSLQLLCSTRTLSMQSFILDTRHTPSSLGYFLSATPATHFVFLPKYWQRNNYSNKSTPILANKYGYWSFPSFFSPSHTSLSFSSLLPLKNSLKVPKIKQNNKNGNILLLQLIFRGNTLRNKYPLSKMFHKLYFTSDSYHPAFILY